MNNKIKQKHYLYLSFKRCLKNPLVIILAMVAHLTSYSQNCATGTGVNNVAWRRTGNSDVPGDNKIGFSGNYPFYLISNDISRLAITNSTYNNYIAVGNNFCAPQSLIHQHESTNNDTWHQFTNSNTGNGNGTVGFKIGLSYQPSYTPGANSFAKLIQYQNAPMKFYTGTGSGISDRMIINSNYNPTIHSVSVNTNGYVGIGLPNFWNEENGGEGPRSLLHMQGPYNAFVNGGNGWRSWMQTGAYINENSDEMYVGMKNEFAINGPNRSDAVIMWGDDQAFAGGTTNADNFRLIFSGNCTNGGGCNTNPLDATSFNGLETMRMTPLGRMGVGPLFTWSTPPSRRLELLDYQDVNGNSQNEPQFRMTYTQANPSSVTTTGTWTDLQTTSNGNLYVHPSSGGTDKSVGINVTSPTQTLDVNGDGRFRGINNGTNSFLVTGDGTGANYGTLHKIDFSNNSTDVLHGDGTWSSAGNGNVNACNSYFVNYVTKWTAANTICDSHIYDIGSTYGQVGVNATSASDFNGPLYSIFGPSYFMATDGTDRVDFDLNTIQISESTHPSVHSAWSIGGGAGNAAAIGNFSPHPFNLRTNNTDRISIYDDPTGASPYIGYVGLATSSPTQELDVNGDARIRGLNAGTNNYLVTAENDGTLHELGFTGNTSQVLLGNGSWGNIGSSVGNVNACSGGTTANFLTRWTSSTNQICQSHVYDYGSGGIGQVGVNATSSSDFNGPISAISPSYFMATDGSNRVDFALNSVQIYDATHHLVQSAWSIGGGAGNAAAIGNFSSHPFSLRTGNTDRLTVDGSGNVGIGTSSPGGLFELSLDQGRKPSTNTWTITSDERLKNIEGSYSKGLKEILQLKPISYHYKNVGDRKFSDDVLKTQNVGFSAQEVQKIFPEAVGEDKDGYLNFNMHSILVAYVNAIKEQQSEIEEQKKEIVDLQNLVKEHLASSMNTDEAKSSIDVSLSSKSIVLNQNQPNPFKEQTTITYFIPDNAKDVKIIFTDAKGNIMKEVSIPEKGKGQLNVYAEDLSSGIYTYTLVADGVSIDTKKMVCNK